MLSKLHINIVQLLYCCCSFVIQIVKNVILLSEYKNVIKL